MTFLRLLLEFNILFLIINLIRTNNPIHAIFHLILIYLLCAFLLLTLQTEYLTFILIIVNIGAVAVLFLFIIIMLDLKKDENYINDNFQQSFIFFIIIIFFILFFYFYDLFYFIFSISKFYNPYISTFLFETIITNSNTDIYAIGSLLYTNYIFSLIFAGILLLIAIIGAISLTHSNNFLNIKKN